MPYTLIKFDKNSQSFRGQTAIQETENGRLVAIYDFDGDQLTSPGGANASWDALSELESEEFWDAVEEAQTKLAAKALGRKGGKAKTEAKTRAARDNGAKGGRPAKRYAVFFVGAPFGENEEGELLSKHDTARDAIERRYTLQGHPQYYGANTKIKVLVDGRWIGYDEQNPEHLDDDCYLRGLNR